MIDFPSGNKVRLDIWDTAGQERFQSLAQNYFRGANGALMVYNVCDKDSFHLVVNWIRNFRSKVDDATRCVLVANQIDRKADRVISEV